MHRYSGIHTEGLSFHAGLLYSVDGDVTVPSWCRFIGPFHLLILNVVILLTAIGEREGASAKLVRLSLSSDAESKNKTQTI